MTLGHLVATGQEHRLAGFALGVTLLDQSHAGLMASVTSLELVAAAAAKPRATDEVGVVSAGMTKCPCGLGELGLSKVRFHTSKKGISRMQLSHTHSVAGAVFDDPNLVSAAGLVPVVALAQRCRLGALADGHLSVPSDVDDAATRMRCRSPVGDRLLDDHGALLTRAVSWSAREFLRALKKMRSTRRPLGCLDGLCVRCPASPSVGRRSAHRRLQISERPARCRPDRFR